MRQITTIIIVLVFVGALIASGLYMGAPGKPAEMISPSSDGIGAQGVTTANSLTPGNYSLIYVVDGMHCNGCAEAIVAEVKELPGVTAVECTYESKRATVAIAKPDLRPAVEHAITKLGYKIALQPAPVSDTDAESSK